jgi:hypothetical protein
LTVPERSSYAAVAGDSFATPKKLSKRMTGSTLVLDHTRDRHCHVTVTAVGKD